MHVNSINLLNFEGTKQNKAKQSKTNNNQNQCYNNSPVSSKASKAVRDMALGLMVLGAAASLTSCDKEVEGETYNFYQELTNNNENIIHIKVGGNCEHHDTITVVEKDTIINTSIDTIYVKDYPFNIADSLIAQGQNIGIPIDGPIPDGTGSDSIVYVGSKAYNRYDCKFYESMVDSTGTNESELAIVTKVVDYYAEEPKTYYMRSIVTNVPGKGIKITRYIANTETKPTKDEMYLYKYSGYEIRTNGSDGQQNIRSIFDDNNNLVYQGDYEKGEEAGSFLYGTIIYDPETGEPYYDDEGNVEFAKYDFDQAVIYSDYAKKSNDYNYPGWQ